MRHDEAPETTPANIPADAVAFVSTRKRNGRFAVFFPDGRLSNTFGFDIEDVVAALAAGGMTVDAERIIRLVAR